MTFLKIKPKLPIILEKNDNHVIINLVLRKGNHCFEIQETHNSNTYKKQYIKITDLPKDNNFQDNLYFEVGKILFKYDQKGYKAKTQTEIISKLIEAYIENNNHNNKEILNLIINSDNNKGKDEQTNIKKLQQELSHLENKLTYLTNNYHKNPKLIDDMIETQKNISDLKLKIQLKTSQ